MKILKTVILTVLVMALCQTAWAQCPNATGTWTTLDGTMIGGRASEGWCGAGGNPVQGGQPGNTQNAMSWDGTTLGTQWKAWGMEIATGAVAAGEEIDSEGTGWRRYSTDYVNGQFWLSKDYSWSDGVADLTGDLTYFNVLTTITYEENVVTGIASTIVFTGQFNDCDEFNDCGIQFSISNALLAWRSDWGSPMPENYPAFLCGDPNGELFDVCCIQLIIDCAVGAEETTWGSLKALYQ